MPDSPETRDTTWETATGPPNWFTGWHELTNEPRARCTFCGRRIHATSGPELAEIKKKHRSRCPR